MQPNCCDDCKQDLIRDCATLYSTHPCLVSLMKRFTAAANYVGIDTHQLVNLLNGGVSVSELLDIIQERLAAEENKNSLVA